MAPAPAGENTSGSRNKGPTASLSAAPGKAASVGTRYVRSSAGVLRPAAGHVASSLFLAGGVNMELSERTESCRLAVPDETSPLLAFPATTACRPRRCSSLGSRDDAPEADAEVVDEEKPPIPTRQLWLNRVKTGVLSLVVVFAVVVMSFIPELTETWTSVAINGNESYCILTEAVLYKELYCKMSFISRQIAKYVKQGPFISEELGNLSGLWTVFTLEGSAEPPVRVPTAPPPLQPTPVQWEHLFPLPRDSFAQQQPPVSNVRALCEVMDLDPKLILIWLVIFSNIGGAATPVGDPPNVIIISNPQVAAMGINFTSFTAHMVPGALLCLVGAYLLLRLRDTKSLRPHEAPELLELQRELDIWRKAYRSLSEYSRDEKHVKDILERKVKRLERLRSRKAAELRCSEEGFRQNLQLLSDKYKIRNPALLVKTGIVLGCVILLFFMQSFPNLHLSLGWIAVLGALLLLVLADLDDLESVMARVEWTTLVFFAALFVVMEALGELQLIYFIGQRTQEWIGALQPQSQRPVAILIVTWVSALASSLMDNIPFTTAMVKVVTGLSEGPSLVYALAWGACLGGNGTLIGASANVVCAGGRRAARPPVHLLRLLQGYEATTPSLDDWINQQADTPDHLDTNYELSNDDSIARLT
ncbi:hypothetical protein MTO96_002558 [Rhipicephalus appendiculatus]